MISRSLSLALSVRSLLEGRSLATKAFMYCTRLLIATLNDQHSRFVTLYSGLSDSCSTLKINLSRRSRDVGTPSVRIDWVLLVDVDFEELVVSRALEVLVPTVLLVTSFLIPLSSLH